MKNISFSDYEIIFDDNLSSLQAFLAAQNYSTVLVLVDEHTKEHCLPMLRQAINDFNVIEIRSGEEQKQLSTCTYIWEQMLSFNTDRNAVLLNLGGGVIGDMGGFSAACYKRGIDFINIPTTLLAQVDASIGGKLGIDFNHGKNLIGLFQNPKAVFISSLFLSTLPHRQYINGWAEIFKHALIGSREQWEANKEVYPQRQDISTVIYHSLLVKKAVVEQDPYEQGRRQILNFGHTIGHALESYALQYDEENLLHGEAIAIGMICEAYLSTKKCGLEQSALEEITQRLLNSFPKRSLAGFDTDKLMVFMNADKKNKNASIRAALLSEIGSCQYSIELSKEDIIDSLSYYSKQ